MRTFMSCLFQCILSVVADETSQEPQAEPAKHSRRQLDIRYSKAADFNPAVEARSGSAVDQA